MAPERLADCLRTLHTRVHLFTRPCLHEKCLHSWTSKAQLEYFDEECDTTGRPTPPRATKALMSQHEHRSLMPLCRFTDLIVYA